MILDEEARLGGREGGDVVGALAVADVPVPVRQGEPVPEAGAGPDLRGAGDAGEVVVLDAAEVPGKPGDRVRGGVGLPEEVLRGEAVEGDGEQFVHAFERVEEQVGAIHSPIVREPRPPRDPHRPPRQQQLA